MDKVRIGLVGKGFAARLHLDSIAGVRGLKTDVVAVASRKSDAGRFCEYLCHSRSLHRLQTSAGA